MSFTSTRIVPVTDIAHRKDNCFEMQIVVPLRDRWRQITVIPSVAIFSCYKVSFAVSLFRGCGNMNGLVYEFDEVKMNRTDSLQTMCLWNLVLEVQDV